MLRHLSLEIFHQVLSDMPFILELSLTLLEKESSFIAETPLIPILGPDVLPTHAHSLHFEKKLIFLNFIFTNLALKMRNFFAFYVQLLKEKGCLTSIFFSHHFFLTESEVYRLFQKIHLIQKLLDVILLLFENRFMRPF